MTWIKRTTTGALVALAVMLGSVTMATASVAGKPNCLATPCPPPENRSAADLDASVQPVDGHHSLVAGVPNCRVPCPPPKDA